MRDISDVLTVSFESGLKDEAALCVTRKYGEKTIMLKMELGEQADILYHLLTEQMTKAVIKAERENKEAIEYTDNWDEICKAVAEMEDKRIYNEMLMKEQIETAVIICNRENKHRLKGLFPNLCVLGTDHCDDKIYMVTDKTIAENIRDTMKWENKE